MTFPFSAQAAIVAMLSTNDREACDTGDGFGSFYNSMPFRFFRTETSQEWKDIIMFEYLE